MVGDVLREEKGKDLDCHCLCLVQSHIFTYLLLPSSLMQSTVDDSYPILLDFLFLLPIHSCFGCKLHFLIKFIFHCWLIGALLWFWRLNLSSLLYKLPFLKLSAVGRVPPFSNSCTSSSWKFCFCPGFKTFIWKYCPSFILNVWKSFLSKLHIYKHFSNQFIHVVVKKIFPFFPC